MNPPDFSRFQIWPIEWQSSTVMPSGVRTSRCEPSQEIETMNNMQQIEASEYDRPAQLQWMEDFDDLTVDDLRELPNHMQLGLDLSVFD